MRTLQALLAVLVLGVGAGTGAMIGLWAGLSWWVGRTRPGDGSGSLLPALGAGALGAVLGFLAGTALAGVALAAVSAARRGQNRSS